MASKIQLDKKILKSFTTFDGLDNEQTAELINKSFIHDYQPNQQLFKQGERDSNHYFLISGQLESSVIGNPKSKTIKAKSSETRGPVEDTLPRQCTVKTKTACSILIVDRDLFEIITDDSNLSTADLQVTELDSQDTTAWMLQFLQSPAFLRLPTQNIQSILMNMEEVPKYKGEVVIQQGEKDDYYYIVRSGKCAVSRKPAPKAKDVQLAILREGDGFGEEALITDGKRNASITMLEDGMLMRMKKKDFLKDLVQPLTQEMSEAEVEAAYQKGSILIDVRNHEAYRQQHVDGSVNIPLSMLRLKLDGLNPDRSYILLCEDGTRSAAAAFLMTQQGLNTSIVKGGLAKSSLKIDQNAPVKSIEVTPVTKRTQAAEKTQKEAENRAQKITQEANTAKHEAEKLAQQRQKLEAERKKAEEEINRLKAEQAKQHQAAVAAGKSQAEKDIQRAQEAEARAKALQDKAEQARIEAEQQLQEVEAAKQANEQKQSSLDEALKRAKQIATESAKAAEDARRQAQKEAEEIKRQALEEAERLRVEMENARKEFEAKAAETESSREAALSAAREEASRHAEQIKEQARQEAEQQAKQLAQTAAMEAEAIKRQAEEEVARMKAELDAAKQQMEARSAELDKQEAARRVSLLEETKQKAVELAEKTTLVAAQEADEIRRQALAEANQIRDEMEQARKEVLEHASRAREEAEQIAREKALKEQQEKLAAKEREIAELEKQRQEEEAEAERIEKEREQKRLAAIKRAKKMRKDEALRMAEQIKAKLEAAEKERQASAAQTGGISIDNATLRRSNGKIILETNEDIFIFKEPSVSASDIDEITTKPSPQPVAKKPESAPEPKPQPVAEKPVFDIKPQPQPKPQPVAKKPAPVVDDTPNYKVETLKAPGANRPKPVVKEELPSFIVDDNVPIAPVKKEAAMERLKVQAQQQQEESKKRKGMAMAAGIVLALVGAGGYLFMNPDMTGGDAPQQTASVIPPQTTLKPQPKPEKQEPSREQQQMSKVKQEAKETFDKLIEKWRQVTQK